MNRLATALISLVLIGMGGYQAAFPKKILRRNRDSRFTWSPEWARKRALSTPNVWAARIAGALCCCAGVFFLAKAVVGF